MNDAAGAFIGLLFVSFVGWVLLWKIPDVAYDDGLRQGSCNSLCGERADYKLVEPAKLRCVCQTKNEIKYLTLTEK